MIKKLTITILADNKSKGPDLLSEHGLSIWIEADNRRILFDTGGSDLLYHNASSLGIDLGTADTLILSHGHYDHTGGVCKILELNPGIAVFCHKGIFLPRYSRQSDGRMKPIGIKISSSSAMNGLFNKINWITEPISIIDGIWVTGPIPRETDFEDSGGDFFFDLDGNCPDPVDDDLSVWLETSNGLFLITGCCHSGIVNTMEYVTRITQQGKVKSIIGGFHLVNASNSRMEKTIEFLKKQSIESIVPLHCTGENAVKMLHDRLGNIVNEGGVGTQMRLSD